MNALWSGRFDSGPADALWAFTVDLDTDRELWPYDIAVNRAHARMLADTGVLDDADRDVILDALDLVEAEFASGEFVFSEGDEDIHSAIERRLTEICGDAGARIHAGRSRNDQVATDFKLWCRDAATGLVTHLDELSAVICSQAEGAGDALAPGYTHLQRAQPVTLAHTLLAHVAAFDRDAERLLDARNRMGESPLGAGALATSTLPLDPSQTAAELGFDVPFSNSIDAVASRDFAVELLAAATIVAMHLSRVAEEIVLWATEEFGVIELDDAWATGSSMMPQKKNPDIAELARAVIGRTSGAFVSLVTVMKGLPLSYKRDMQEDKAATFQALERLDLALVGMRGLIATARFDLGRLEAAASGASAAATDLAERLVMAGVPFRQAHEIVAGFVAALREEGRHIEEATPEELAGLHDAFGDVDGEWLSARAAVERRTMAGGPHPDKVSEALAGYRRRIAGRSDQ